LLNDDGRFDFLPRFIAFKRDISYVTWKVLIRSLNRDLETNNANCLQFHKMYEGGGLYDMIYLLTALGLSPGGSTHLHTKNI